MSASSRDHNIVLIVDDSPDTLGMLHSALELENMTTLVALEGAQALTIARCMMPDVILLDALMPNMDGFETCQHLKSDDATKHIPIIFMTGLTDTASVVRGFEAGGVDYLTKPIKHEELIARIRVHLAYTRTTLSVQNALDSAGQNIFAVNAQGKTQWSTPYVNRLLTTISQHWDLDAFEVELALWLTRLPNEGDKLPLCGQGINITAVYFSNAEEGEYLIRLVDDKALDEVGALKTRFTITQREAEVHLWLAKGKTNREIAQILELSPRTVNKHLEQLFKKLNVDNRTSAAGLALGCLQKVMGY